MRLIDADALVNEICVENCGHIHDGDCPNCYPVDKLVEAPTIEPASLRPKGEWIDNLDENGKLCNAWRKCSACGGHNYSKKPNFCPNCGADMRGSPNDS